MALLLVFLVAKLTCVLELTGCWLHVELIAARSGLLLLTFSNKLMVSSCALLLIVEDDRASSRWVRLLRMIRCLFFHSPILFSTDCLWGLLLSVAAHFDFGEGHLEQKIITNRITTLPQSCRSLMGMWVKLLLLMHSWLAVLALERGLCALTVQWKLLVRLLH